MKRMSRVLILWATLFNSLSVRAYDASLPGSRYTSARAAAMGEQYIGSGASGGEALFYNPALLPSFDKQFHFEPIDLQFYGNANFFRMNGIAIQKSLQLSNQIATLENNSGIYSSSGWSYLTDVYFKGFAFGLLLRTETAAEYYGQNVLYYVGKYRLIPAIATGIPLFNDRLRLGYSLQWVNQASGKNEVLANSSGLEFNSQLAQGSGFSHTLGLEFMTQWHLVPQIDLVVRNLFGLTFGSNSLIQFTTSSIGVPSAEPVMVDTSLGGVHKMGQHEFLTYSISLQDLLGASGIPFVGRLGGGLSLLMNKSLSISAGSHYGYFTAGVKLTQDNVSASLSTFGLDAGDSYHQLVDRRILFQYEFTLKTVKKKQESPI